MANQNIIILGTCILALLVLLSAVFSAAETSYSFVSRAKIESNYRKGRRSAKLIRKHYHKFGWTLATILISNNLVNIGASALFTFMLSKTLLSDNLVTIISTVVLTPIIVIFGELIPKLIAKKHPYKYLTFVVYLIEFLNYLFWPFTFPLSKLALSSKITNSENDLRFLVKLAKNEGVLETQEAMLVQKALDLDSTQIVKIMTKKPEIASLNFQASIMDAKLVFMKSGHSRLPVLKNSKFVGIILLKDIVFQNESELIKDYIKPVLFISKNVLASRALEQLRLNKSHIALVIDPSNAKRVIGLITLEDIVESLIGEIYDEHDKVESIHEISHFKWIANGATKMKELTALVDLSILSEEVKNSNAGELTIKQWLQDRIKRRIKKNLKYVYQQKLIFKVLINKPKKDELVIQIHKK